MAIYGIQEMRRKRFNAFVKSWPEHFCLVWTNIFFECESMISVESVDALSGHLDSFPKLFCSARY